MAALEAIHDWLAANDDSNPVDTLVGRLAFAETLGQLVGGLPMGQNELFRPADLGLGQAARALAETCASLIDADHATTRASLVAALAEGQWPSETFHDADSSTPRR